MFGFFKKKPLVSGPVEFKTEIEINAPASKIYPLVDVSGPDFTHVRMGNSVSMVAKGERPGLGQFVLKMKDLDDLTFHLLVTDAQPNQRHTHECVIEPLVGKLLKTIETVEIEPINDAKCRVIQTVEVTFEDGMSEKAVANELLMMTMSVENALEKLAIHAEEGTEAVKSYEAEYF